MVEAFFDASIKDFNGLLIFRFYIRFMSLDLFEVSFLFVGLQALLFAVVLFISSKGQKLSAIFLGLFLLTLAVQSGVLLNARSLGEDNMPFAYLCVFGFLYGPFLWLYAQSLIYKEFEFKLKYTFHFLPALLLLSSAVAGWNLCGTLGSLFYLSLFTYTGLIIKMLLNYRRVVVKTQSTNKDIKLEWLQWIVIVFTLTFLIDIYEHFVGDLEVINGLSFVNFLLIVLINSIYYKGLRQPGIFQGISDEERQIASSVSKELDTEPNEALDRLRVFMQAEKPYLDAGLTLSQLAKMLDIQPRKLSVMINDHLGQNFMDFINTYRISEAKYRLQHPKDDKETVLEVMYAIGFNSKSSFNTVFKKKVGKTPSEYKRDHLGLRSDL